VQADRFYGLEIPPQVAAAALEGLTDLSIDNLVEAHLKINYSYFGAIDKTLSGFFVLDSEGDNYTLLDLRGDGRVWWQDHETRRLYPHFDTLDDWLGFKADLDKGGDEDELRNAYRGKSANREPAGTPSTAALAERYQWLVWLLAQPLRDRNGNATQTDADLAGAAAGHLRAAFPTDAAMAGTLQAELPLLADDPHLAVYWLLHTTVLARQLDRVRVLAAIRPEPFLQAFVTVFGDLPLDGDVALVPGFRERRALLAMYASGGSPEEEQPRIALNAMRMAPWVQPLMKAAVVESGLADGTLTDAEVSAALDRTEASAGTAALRAVLDQRAGLDASHHADELARSARGPGEEWAWVFNAVWQVHELIRDADALTDVVRFLLDKDPYHVRILALAEYAQRLSGRALFDDDRLRLAEASTAVLDAMTDDEPAIDDPELREVVARRVLLRAEASQAVLSWAVRTTLAGDAPDKTELVGTGLLQLPFWDPEQLPVSDDVLLWLLRNAPEPDESDFAATFAADQRAEKILQALAPRAHEPRIFDVLLRLTGEPVWEVLFSPFEEDTYILHRLTDEQAVRAAKAMVASSAPAAGHQLYRFDHKGAEAYLVEALSQRHDDEDLTANLYSAVRNVGARDALVERLWTERHAYWRMGNAIGDIFDAELHRDILNRLRATHDGHAAGCYAFALADFVQQGPPKVELLAELATWPVPTDEVPRRFFKYGLIIGIEAALVARNFQLVRTAHAVAESIAEPPLEPDQHARGTGWENPIDQAQLRAVLDGTADAERQRLVEKGVTAKATGMPRRKISDRSLGVLAGVDVARRLMHDPDTGEVWFLDTEGVVHAFDGYEIAPPPFEVGAGPVTELSERALFWDRGADNFIEIIRDGNRVAYVWGRNNGRLERLTLAFAGPAAAQHAFARLKSSTDLTETSPWYVPGRGAVVRTYSGKRYLCVFGNKAELHGQPLASEADAIAEHQRQELDGVLTCLEWMDSYRRPEDLTVREWIRGRIRDDARDATWHVRALTEVTDYLAAHGYPQPMNVAVGDGVAEEEIAAFEAQRQHPVPDVLRAFWREVGHASWSDGAAGLRVLSPAQMLERRPAARELGETYLAAMPPSRASAARSVLGALDVLVETLDGTAILTVLAEGVFTHVGRDPDDFWWEQSLSWMLATRFLDSFAEAVEEAVPVVAQLYCGQRLNPTARRRYFQLGDRRFWELFVDTDLGVVSTREGRPGATGAVKTRRYEPAQVERRVAKLVARKTAEGYVEAVA
jgi:predicted DNA-binding WGR domain protein